MTLRGLLDESKGPGKKRGSFMIFTLTCVIKIKFHGRKVEIIWAKFKKGALNFGKKIHDPNLTSEMMTK